jgi:3'-phosphoadenosine 5'-phosphosulfate (PAPS) 3'-phosphatase
MSAFRRMTALLVLLSLSVSVLLSIVFLFPVLWSPRSATLSPHDLFEVLARAIVQAGDEIVDLRRDADAGESQSNGTYADGSVERHTKADARSSLLLGRVAASFPGLSVVDEERVALGAYGGSDAHGLRRGRGAARDARDDGPASRARLPVSELTVWIDPLDATAEYSEGGELTRFVTLSGCIARHGVPLAGIIYAPFSRRLYWSTPAARSVAVAFDVGSAIEAERARAGLWDEPAVYCDCSGEGGVGGPEAQAQRPESASRPLSVISQLEPDSSLPLRVLVSRSHASSSQKTRERTQHSAATGKKASEVGLTLHEIFSRALGGSKSVDIIPAGGAGFKALQVIEKSADVYAHMSGIRKWDLCAADALLRAEGGKLTNWRGDNICYCTPKTPDDVNVDGVLALADAGAHGVLREALSRVDGSE